MRESAGSILMFVENSFPQDTRVKNEAFKLQESGYNVIVLALIEGKQSLTEVLNGVRVFRVPELSLFKKSHASSSWLSKILYYIKSSIGYITEYAYFTSVCFFYSIYISLRHGFDAIHIHNPPNTLFLVGLFHKIFGKKIVFDHHDLSPELYLSRYDKKNGGLIHKVLMIEEKLCLRSADIVIATNETYKAIDIERGKKRPDQIFVVRNGPNLDKFKPVDPDEQLLEKAKHILVYIGIMGPQDGVDYLLHSLSHLVHKSGRTDFYCVIIGTGDALDDLKELAVELDVNDYVWFTDYIPFGDLRRYLSSAHICLDPNPSNPLNDSSTWIKVMEYMAFSKPIVSFELKETKYSARDAAVYVTPNDVEEYAGAIKHLMDNPDERKWRGEFGLKRINDELSWNHVSKNLIAAYEALGIGRNGH